MPEFLKKNKPAQLGKFNIELTISVRGKTKPDLLDEENTPFPVSLYYPEETLKHFQDIIKDTKLCGQKFYNPYTEEEEQFPEEPSEFTARHLQLLARNEYANTSGVMDCSLYGGLITADQIARIRCLVKQTVVVGKVTASHWGGYGPKQKAFPKPEEVILIDQIGYQWQGDFRNTGGLYFYPEDPKAASLPSDYQQWQKAMYLQVHGEERPAKAPAEHTLKLLWDADLDGKKPPVRGVFDLDALQKGFEIEFQQALSALLEYSNKLPDDKPINFKFLKAGMGAFSDGLRPLHNKDVPIRFLPKVQKEKNDDLATLELTRLQGILSALKTFPDNTDFGRIKRLTLPFSNHIPELASAAKKAQFNDIFNNIEKECKRLNLEWGGAERRDALEPASGYITATTNCADPHAMIGNEGGHASVDASLSSNIPNIFLLNVAYNKQVSCLAFPEFSMIPALVDISEGEEEATPPEPTPQPDQGTQEQNPWLRKLMTLLKVIQKDEKDLRARGHFEAADKALAVYTRVDTNRKNLINKQISPAFFEEDSLKAVEEAREVLEQHRETKGKWGQILGNLSLAIVGLAAFYLAAVLINYAVNGRFLFFPPATAGHLDDLRNHINRSQRQDGSGIPELN